MFPFRPPAGTSFVIHTDSYSDFDIWRVTKSKTLTDAKALAVRRFRRLNDPKQTITIAIRHPDESGDGDGFEYETIAVKRGEAEWYSV